MPALTWHGYNRQGRHWIPCTSELGQKHSHSSVSRKQFSENTYSPSSWMLSCHIWNLTRGNKQFRANIQGSWNDIALIRKDIAVTAVPGQLLELLFRHSKEGRPGKANNDNNSRRCLSKALSWDTNNIFIFWQAEILLEGVHITNI